MATMDTRAFPTIISVNVFDTEIQRNRIFELRLDRLRAFYQLAVTHRRVSQNNADMPGVSGVACEGLREILVRDLPPNFRLENFLEYLEREQTVYGPHEPDFGFWDRLRGKKTTRPLLDPPLTVQEIEGTLEEFKRKIEQGEID